MKILAISDIHGEFDRFSPDALPDADVLLFAGDATNDGTRRPREIAAAEEWFRRAVRRFTFVRYVLGNHDIRMADTFFNATGAISLEANWFQYFDVFFRGASLSTCFDVPGLALEWERMTADPAADRDYFASIPCADVLVSHSPPFGCLDEWISPGSGRHIGSPGALTYIERHAPRLCVCGHIHEAAGMAKIGPTLVVNTARRAALIDLTDASVSAEFVV